MKALIALLLVLTPHLEAATLWAVIVSDTFCQGLHDSVCKDRDAIHALLMKAAKSTNMKYHETLLVGLDSHPDIVYHAAKKIAPGPDDAIFFHYSGHGFRVEKKQTPWPYLYFTVYDLALDFEKIIDLYKEKNARLTICIADCCNNIIPEREYLVTSRARGPDLAAGFKKLFRDAKGSVFLTSSKPGQVSWGSSRGGFFTQKYVAVLTKALMNPKKADWASIITEASTGIVITKNGESFPQNPYFVIKN